MVPNIKLGVPVKRDAIVYAVYPRTENINSRTCWFLPFGSPCRKPSTNSTFLQIQFLDNESEAKAPSIKWFQPKISISQGFPSSDDSQALNFEI